MARQSKTKARDKRRREAEAQREKEARAKQIRTGIFAVIGAVVVIGGMFAVWPRQSEEQKADEAASSFGAETWDLPQLDGNGRVRIEDFRGKPTVAVFFANWCEVCEDEVPEMLALSQSLADEVNFVGIDMMDNGGGLGDAQRWGIAGVWPLAEDVGNGNGSTLSARTFGARGSPLHVFYDADGNVIFTLNGGMSPEDVVSVLESNGQL